MANKDYREADSEVLAGLPLNRLNAEIARRLYGYRYVGAAQGRKAFFKRLVMLEAARESAC
ncbi:hypothetical protein IV454_19805 [Massilia antarctica]|uniref:Uncharacterized protein n=1 Tax=Massilia antarctica TaxID=2765360 RepID=A0AA49A6R8_9BURK|nr:hypothetical protein [Massilia antarctica]QPI47810.1 hypothetical protein IV454_19805 [Massilia antarctica]